MGEEGAAGGEEGAAGGVGRIKRGADFQETHTVLTLPLVVGRDGGSWFDF